MAPGSPQAARKTRTENQAVTKRRGNISNRIRIQAGVDDDSVDTNKSRLQRHVHTISGTGVSFLVHMAVMLLLALFVFAEREPGQLGMIAEITAPMELDVEPPNDNELIVDMVVEVEDNHSVIEQEAIDNSLAEETDLPTIADSNDQESESNLSPIENLTPVKPEQIQPLGGGLEGRESGSRSSLAARYGGTAASELAVENGLRWLADHQFADGSWRLDFTKGPCQGRCRNPATRETTTAATGLALMAFLGAGYTHKGGPYKQQVQAGLDYLISRIRKSYWGGNLAEGTMYAQAIATIALSEAYTMTRDPKLKPEIDSAMEYIVTAQHSAGGWRYSPGEPGDTTVTGWQMMALKSCELAGISVPAATIKKGRLFLASVGDESTGQFGYKSKDADPTSTAIGLLIQMYHGWSREHRGVFEGSRYLVKLGPSKNNIYFNYYATLALFHARHSDWDQWNQQMRDYLVRTQAKKGHSAGSWFFKEKYGSVGGRLYTTAMAVMILEVYYRYLPLFDSEPVDAAR